MPDLDGLFLLEEFLVFQGVKLLFSSSFKCPVYTLEPLLAETTSGSFPADHGSVHPLFASSISSSLHVFG